MYRVLCGDEVLHDPRSDDRILTDLRMGQSLNESGWCTFTMAPGHPAAGTVRERDAARPVEVYDGDDLIFSGFVNELGLRFQLTREVSCKGELAYLGDSAVRPYSEGGAPSDDAGFFAWLIDNHNRRVEPAKRFSMGRNEARKISAGGSTRSLSSISTTADQLQSQLLDAIGGYVFVRHTKGKRYIDYLAECADANAQIIDFGENLLDFAKTDSVKDMATAIVPTGKDDLTLAGISDLSFEKGGLRFEKQGDRIVCVEASEQYGIIEAGWSDTGIEDANELLARATVALMGMASPKVTIEIRAVDKALYSDATPLRLGQLVRVRSLPHSFDSYMLVAAIEPDLNDPAQTIYTLGTTFDTLTGETNKRIRQLNAQMDKQADKVTSIGKAAKNAADQAVTAQTLAEAAGKLAGDALTDAATAQSKADSAQTQADAANTAAGNAQAKADKASQSAIAAQEAADKAQADVDKVEESVSGLETSVGNAQAAAEQAAQAAATADEKAVQAQASADAAAQQAIAANTAAGEAKSAADDAKSDAAEAQSTADNATTLANEASTTANAAKLDAQKANEDIEALGEDLESLSNTMTLDYARKTDLTEATASLQTQISQNAAGIELHASQIATVDETANNAAETAAAAQKAASDAQTQADQATEDAAAAQKVADDAASAAGAAQAEADAAKAAAATAQSAADKAKADLEAAEADLATVTSRVDSTEADIAAAQKAVTDAQAAADKAQADATSAASAASTAQTKANEAASAASAAQSKADEAAGKADDAQALAEQAGTAAQAAQAKADKAAEDAAAAQSAADKAAEDAATAQGRADAAANAASAAQSAADAADVKAAQAAADLATAEQNLADVTSRVDATEEEVEAAKADVEAAQKAADDANAAAEAAQSTADTAKADAATAASDAATAKEAADKAQADAKAAQEAADKAQGDVDSLSVTVTEYDARITENARQIELRATKAEVTETLGGYYTKEETDSAISVEAGKITTAVSNTYATKTALSATDEKAADAQTAADAAQDAADAVAADLDENYSTTVEMNAAISVESGSIKSHVESTYATKTSLSETDEKVANAQAAIEEAEGNLSDVIGGVQGELDSAKEDIVGIQNSNAEVYEIVYQNQSKISELVQVSSGFEMNFQTITDSITQINDQYVTDRDEQYKYIRFIDGEIWIGKLPEEGEDDLQLVMRNDRISFLLNNVEIAYFSDDALYVTNVTVTGKLTVGRWEWSERSNGNLGLRWVGGE